MDEWVPELANLQPRHEVASLGKRDFAQRHSVSQRTVDYWRERGLPFLAIGRRKILIPVVDGDLWLHRKFLVSSTAKRTPARPGGVAP